MVRVGYSTEQLPDPNNRVTLADEKDPLGVPRQRLSYTVDDYSKNALAYGHSVAFRILSSIEGMEEIDPHGPEGKYNGAGHPMGTCRMGRDAGTAVVDPDGRSFEHPNVFVVGASVFVTGSAANPTLTLAALTLRTADRIKASYHRSTSDTRATLA
jgi:choline dehydrogenase-like flavoprotein